MARYPEPGFVDGWLLMAMLAAYEEGGLSLSKFYAAADMLNHAIPTDQEVRGVLSKLASIGAVESVGGRILLAPELLAGMSTVRERRGGLFQLPDNARLWLKQNELPDRFPNAIAVSDEELAEGRNASRTPG